MFNLSATVLLLPLLSRLCCCLSAFILGSLPSLYSQTSAFGSVAFGLHVDNPADFAEFRFILLHVRSAALGKILPPLQR